MTDTALIITLTDSNGRLKLIFNDGSYVPTLDAEMWQKRSFFTDLEFEWTGDIGALPEELFTKIGQSVIARLTTSAKGASDGYTIDT